MPLKKQTKLQLFSSFSIEVKLLECLFVTGQREGIYEKGSLYIATLLHFLIMHCLFINEEEKLNNASFQGRKQLFALNGPLVPYIYHFKDGFNWLSY